VYDRASETCAVIRAGDKGMLMHTWRRDEFEVSTDPGRLDLETIHAFLSTSYWANDIAREVLERAIAGSIPFGLYHGPRLVGFARAVTDRATFAYLGDVFVLESYRGRGLATWLTQCTLEHPDLVGLRNWLLATRDAHAVYARCGYQPLASPGAWMQRRGARYDGSAGVIQARAAEGVERSP
jgi:GNAT superfamily N-acetyltransferase